MSKNIENTELIYHFIKAYIDENQNSPSIREIASGCFMSVGNVMRYLDRLEHQQRIMRIPSQARSIRLLTVSDPHSKK